MTKLPERVMNGVESSRSRRYSKEGEALDRKELWKEMLYQTTMHIVRKMLSDGVVSEEEYHRFETIYSEKYKPVLGTLFSSMALTSTQ